MELSLQKSSRFKPNQWNPLGETMWGIMVPTKYPHQQKYPWSSKKLDQGQFKTPMLASFRHSSSKLSGKNAMEGIGQFHWHLLPVAGAIWFYKNHAVVKEWCLIQCCSPYHFINGLYACQIIWGGKRGRIFHSPTNQHHSSSSTSNALKESTKIRTSR